MFQRLPGFVRYCAVFLLTVLLCVAALFLFGLLPQNPIEQNYLRSIDEIEREWKDPNILRGSWGSYTLDDWSEVLILSLSTYMDVPKDPSSVLKNSYPLEDNYTLDDARNTVANQDKAHVFYVRYWHGFRTYVRAMLSCMDYDSMRTFIMWGFFLLMSGSALTIAFQTRSAWPPMLFVASVLFVNPVVASAMFQYSICFLLAFLGVLAVPRWQKKPERIPIDFMLLGMLTMYFDFYTTPLLTFCIPLLAYWICRVYSSRSPSAKSMLLDTLKYFCVWFAAYILMWVTKLALTTAFTDQNAFLSAFQSAQERLGIVKDPNLLFRYSKTDALLALFRHLFDWPLLIAFLAAMVAGVFAMLRLRVQRAAYAKAGVFLAIACFPFLWTLVATQPMYMHGFFQYRIVMITMLGGLYGWLLCLDRSRLPDVHLPELRQ
ncbi:MAG: hypothetical protein LLF75_12505 [Eubacteriales bacterium]|nr:hypothetical protein [Eubacteriales bacterium]